MIKNVLVMNLRGKIIFNKDCIKKSHECFNDHPKGWHKPYVNYQTNPLLQQLHVA